MVFVQRFRAVIFWIALSVLLGTGGYGLSALLCPVSLHSERVWQSLSDEVFLSLPAELIKSQGLTKEGIHEATIVIEDIVHHPLQLSPYQTFRVFLAVNWGGETTREARYYLVRESQGEEPQVLSRVSALSYWLDFL